MSPQDEREAVLVKRLRSLAGRSDSIVAVALREAADALAVRQPGAEYRRGVEDAARVADEAVRLLPFGTEECAVAASIATAIRLLRESTKGDGRD
jgi:hypothetical protein